jgi:hypothetical protein
MIMPCNSLNKMNTNIAICPRQYISKNLIIPAAVVSLSNGNKFLTTILNASESEIDAEIPEIELEGFDVNLVENLTDIQVHNYETKDKIISRPNEISKLLMFDHLNEEEKGKIKELCLDFAGVFYLDNEPLTFTNNVKHTINTENHKPVYSKPYKYPQIFKEEVKNQIGNMLKQNIIRESGT